MTQPVPSRLHAAAAAFKRILDLALTDPELAGSGLASGDVMGAQAGMRSHFFLSERGWHNADDHGR